MRHSPATSSQDLSRWPASRYPTFVAVLGMHALLIALLWLAPSIRNAPAPPLETVELLELAPPTVPKVKAENNPMRQLRAALPLPPMPRLDDAPLTTVGAQADRSAEGSGSGVDWAAEARRAVRAFNIRNDRLDAASGPSGAPAFDDAWLYAKHRRGEEFKTPDGDWIVWIDANCYQVAAARTGSGASGGPQGRIYCMDQGRKPPAAR